jgi:CRISPR/Cas system-associated exonuclease Cas4 (RecB family)
MAAAACILNVESPGDVLSPSTANGYLGCSAKIYFRKVLKLPDPPTGALTMGSAVHAAIGANFEQKMETRVDLPGAGVQAIYNEAWDLLVKGEYPSPHGGKPSLPTEFRDDENPVDLKAQGLALVMKYLDEACPEIDPAAVELPVVGQIAGVTVRGFIDLLDSSGCIIDLKTAARKPSEISMSLVCELSGRVHT